MEGAENGSLIDLPEIGEAQDALAVLDELPDNIYKHLSNPIRDVLSLAGKRQAKVIKAGKDSLLIQYELSLPPDLLPVLVLDASAKDRIAYDQQPEKPVWLKRVNKRYDQVTVHVTNGPSGKRAFWANDNYRERVKDCAAIIRDRPDNLGVAGDGRGGLYGCRRPPSRASTRRQGIASLTGKLKAVSDNLLKAQQEEEQRKRIASGDLSKPLGPIISTPKIKPPMEGRPRWRFLTRPEAERLLAAFQSDHARLLYTICLYSGCRKGQAIALTWDRVDFENNRIDFNEPDLADTVKRRAIVPMGAKLRAAMEAAYALRTIEHVIEFDGARATKVRWPWNRARKRAGLGMEVTPHVLRHTAASWLAMAGIPIEQASDLLACDPKTLRKVYRKFDPEYLSEAVIALEGA